jgi:hypothetical protein
MAFETSVDLVCLAFVVGFSLCLDSFVLNLLIILIEVFDHYTPHSSAPNNPMQQQQQLEVQQQLPYLHY